MSFYLEKKTIASIYKIGCNYYIFKKHSLSFQGAREIKTQIKQINDIEVLGPIDSPLLK